MAGRNNKLLMSALVVAGIGLVMPAQGQFREDFSGATETGGGVYLNGSGQLDISGWDDGLFGESAFGLTYGHAKGTFSAYAQDGAGHLQVTGLGIDMLAEDFEGATGSGSGGYTDWDDGLAGEEAFFGLWGDATHSGIAEPYADLTQGVGGTACGVMDVTGVTPNTGGWYGGLKWEIPGFPSLPVSFRNGSFEEDGTLPFDFGLHPAGWTIGGYGHWLEDDWGWQGSMYVESGQATPHHGSYALKMWKAWWESFPNYTSCYQDITIQPGDVVDLKCWTSHIASDAMTGDNRAEMEIGFLDESGTMISSNGIIILEPSASYDTWYENDLQATAPAGAVNARIELIFRSTSSTGDGACFYDDVSIKINGLDANPDILGGYELSADVRGYADAAGENYGTINLTVEDRSGNRLVYESPQADNSWQSIGGALNTFEERDSENNPTTGVFDPYSDPLVVTVSYGDGWGAGGTIMVDNLDMPNDDLTGCDYFAGLFWEDLVPFPTPDTRRYALLADVIGDTPGAALEVRVEGYEYVPCLDEDFETITEDSEVQIGGPGWSGGSEDWNSEIEHEEAFFGYQDAEVTETGSVYIRGLSSGGNPGACGKIEVTDVYPYASPVGMWWAGVVWRNQTLSSMDLSEIFLTADIKGEWNSSWLQEPVQYELKFEDSDGDWIGFTGTTTGAWESIGGALSMANGGSGDFDMDMNATYSIAVVILGYGDQGSYGNWGGSLYFDNIQISPCLNPLKNEVGRFAFGTEATGDWQTIGGALEMAETAIPARGGVVDGGMDDVDYGVEGEMAFAGGWMADPGVVTAEGCTDCGVGGSGAFTMSLDGIYIDPVEQGTYWAGYSWSNVAIDMSDASQVTMTADLRSEWTVGEGQVAGYPVIRLESGENYLYFEGTSDGQWHTVGGSMDTATLDGSFDYSAGTYSVVVIAYTNDLDEGPFGQFWVDNIEIQVGGETVFAEDFDAVLGPTPPFMMGFEAYTVAFSMGGIDTWGLTDGHAAIDNVALVAIPGSADGDDDLDLADFAMYQACFSGANVPVEAGCEFADTDGDGDCDLDDLRGFDLFLTGPQ